MAVPGAPTLGLCPGQLATRGEDCLARTISGDPVLDRLAALDSTRDKRELPVVFFHQTCRKHPCAQARSTRVQILLSIDPEHAVQKVVLLRTSGEYLYREALAHAP